MPGTRFAETIASKHTRAPQMHSGPSVGLTVRWPISPEMLWLPRSNSPWSTIPEPIPSSNASMMMKLRAPSAIPFSRSAMAW